jgi:hypothetical protein
VTACGPEVSSVGNFVERPHLGIQIANSRGVPGTLGCVAHTLHDRQPVLLSTWHVLFGGGAQRGDAVWLVGEAGGERVFSTLGRTLYGKIGIVHFGGEDFYVDCAVGSCTGPAPALTERFRLRTSLTPFVAGHDVARLGSLVTKTGAATGTTSGIIVDVNYSNTVCAGGPLTATPKQLLVRPTNGHPVFSAEGDSGALILDESNRAVGLLWGTNTRGEGVACAVAPVLYAMNIAL